MPTGDLFAVMYVAYAVAATGVLLVASGVLIWLLVVQARRGSRSSRLLGQEFIWTLVPVLVVVGLSVLGRIPHGDMALVVVHGGTPLHDRSR